MKVCCVDGCENTNILAKGMCVKHYMQIRRNNKILERTRYDRNEYHIINWLNIIEVTVYDWDNNPINTFIVDDDKLNLILKYKWSLSKLGYIISTDNLKRIYLHKLLTKDYFSGICDHSNGDKRDNRIVNLREATSSKNNMNSNIKGNKSGRIGVFKLSSKKEPNWWAYIGIDKKRINLGYFDTFEDACKAREEAEIKYFGEFQSYIYRKDTP